MVNLVRARVNFVGLHMLLVYGVQFYKHISSILHPTDASHCPFTRCPLKLLSEFTAFHRHPEPPIFISKDPDSALNPDPARH